jgi:hypothetical protein
MIETGWNAEGDEDSMIREVKKFYKAAFGREWSEKDGYSLEWLHRFRTGHPESYMDLRVQKIFEHMKGLCGNNKLEAVV